MQTEGIVLKSIPFKERDLIITVFTPFSGLIKLFIKKTSFRQRALCETFTRGEFIYTLGKSSLYRFHDGALLAQHLYLRDSLPALESACKIAQALIDTQWQGKASPHLYQLFRVCLEKLQGLTHPESLYPLFLLKMLKHEGMLQLDSNCIVCLAQKSGYRFCGESYCQKHAPQNALFFSESEDKLLHFLLEERSFQKIRALHLDIPFISKVEELFNHSLLQLR